MNGLLVTWKCSKCGTEMRDRIGIVQMFEVDGREDFVSMRCDKCNAHYFVNVFKQEIVLPVEDTVAHDAGVCCF